MTTDVSDTAFRAVEKHYKLYQLDRRQARRRAPLPDTDFSRVIDVNAAAAEQVAGASGAHLRCRLLPTDTASSFSSSSSPSHTLAPMLHALVRCYTVKEIPGLVILANAIREDTQVALCRSAILQLGNAAVHPNSLSTHAQTPLQTHSYQPPMRWATLGFSYQWSSKRYDAARYSPMPGEVAALMHQLRQLAAVVEESEKWEGTDMRHDDEEDYAAAEENRQTMDTKAQGQDSRRAQRSSADAHLVTGTHSTRCDSDDKSYEPLHSRNTSRPCAAVHAPSADASQPLYCASYEPQTAIVNYFPVGSMMMCHQDISEEVLHEPLISVTLGCSAIFLMGGQTREEAPYAFRLSSGDVAFFTGPTRTAFHAVPRILDDCPDFLTLPKDAMTQAERACYTVHRTYAHRSEEALLLLPSAAVATSGQTRQQDYNKDENIEQKETKNTEDEAADEVTTKNTTKGTSSASSCTSSHVTSAAGSSCGPCVHDSPATALTAGGCGSVVNTPAMTAEERERYWRLCMRHMRININVRQVYPHRCSQLFEQG